MSADPLIEGHFLQRLKAGLKSRERVYQILVGADISKNWVKETFQGPSLFFDDEILIVLRAEDILLEGKQALLEAKEELESRQVLLCSTSKNMAQDERLKKCVAQDFSIIMPPPWDMPKLLDYLALEYNYPLPPAVRTFILDAVEPQVSDFSDAIITLQLESPDPQKLTLERARELIALKRWDYFQWAAQFARKDKRFFCELVSRGLSDKELLSFFRFMQTYLLKMLDPSYLIKKKGPSKFDREIEALAKQWLGPEIVKAMNLFSRLEKKAKEGHFLLETQLKTEHLQRYL